MTIWKFQLKTVAVQAVSMPPDAKILSVQDQYGIPCLWAVLDPDAQTVQRCIEIFGTGHEVPTAERNYIGTVQDADGFVWHVFERLK